MKNKPKKITRCWEDHFTDDDGKRRHLSARKKKVSFAWVVKEIGISRSTLERNAINFDNNSQPIIGSGALLTCAPPHQTTTRTDWVWVMMQKLRPVGYNEQEFMEANNAAISR